MTTSNNYVVEKINRLTSKIEKAEQNPKTNKQRLESMYRLLNFMKMEKEIKHASI